MVLLWFTFILSFHLSVCCAYMYHLQIWLSYLAGKELVILLFMCNEIFVISCIVLSFSTGVLEFHIGSVSIP